MAFGELLRDGTVFDFIARNLDARAFNSDRWTFIHIPKTAGSSFREELANVIQPDFNLEIDYSKIDPTDQHNSFDDAMDLAIAGFLASPNAARVKLVSGHFRYRDLKRTKLLVNSRLITMLRNPIDRLISDYTFQLSEHHPLHQEVRRRYPSFRHFFTDPTNHNVMFDNLCEDRSQSARECLDAMARNFSFVGVQEMYPLSIKLVFMMLGMRIDPSLNLRRSDLVASMKDRLTPYDRAMLKLYNRKDFFIWNEIYKTFRKAEIAFYQYSDFNRFFKMVNGLPAVPF